MGFIQSLQQYSILVAIWAAIGAAVTIAARQIILKGVNTSFRPLELGLLRRSAFTERIQNQRFNLVIEISQKLERIRSDLERLVQGRLENEDVATKGEIRALTQIFEDLRVIRVVLGPELTDLLQGKADLAAEIASQWAHLRRYQGDLLEKQVKWEKINSQIYVTMDKIFEFHSVNATNYTTRWPQLADIYAFGRRGTRVIIEGGRKRVLKLIAAAESSDTTQTARK